MVDLQISWFARSDLDELKAISLFELSYNRDMNNKQTHRFLKEGESVGLLTVSPNEIVVEFSGPKANWFSHYPSKEDALKDIRLFGSVEVS